MNIEALFNRYPDKVVNYALTGAFGGYGRTLLAQTRYTPRVKPALLLDYKTNETYQLCLDLGYKADDLAICATEQEVVKGQADKKIVIIGDSALLQQADWQVLVEATGNPSAGFAMSRDTLNSKRHVVIVSKEVDSIAGVYLATLARKNKVVYTTPYGDQPGNLISLIGWARTLGLEIIAAGKSTEYDLDFDPKTGEVNQNGTIISAPELTQLLERDDLLETLKKRQQATSALKQGATADYCEMSVVANAVGFLTAHERMLYPVARIDELADIYALKADGGLLDDTGPVVDVFTALRLPNEASFGGGVFVIVKTNDPVAWETIRSKGHVVSRDGKYACIYLPYHYMGIETPISILDAEILGLPTGAVHPRQHVLLAGRAINDIPAGTELVMGGHHHDVEGVASVLVPTSQIDARTAPLYLASFAKTTRVIRAGELISIDDIEGYDKALLEAYQAGDKDA